MKYLFCGDPHGDLDFIQEAAALAAEHDAEIICLGDWGFIWPGRNQLQALSLVLRRAGEKAAKPPVKMRFIDGNHDWHTKLREMMYDSLFEDKRPMSGYEFAKGVIYQPRGSVHEDTDGTRFLFCGGAPSIDHERRTEGRSWWEKEEVISEAEYEFALAASGPIHVLVTHDAPMFPPGYGPKGTPEFRLRGIRSMEMIAGLMTKHKPELLMHGHWHTRYSTVLGGTKVIGLDHNNAYLDNAVLLWSRNEVS